MTPGIAQKVGRARPSLAAIQGPITDVLDRVLAHMERVLEADVPFIDEVAFHLGQMRGKMFRPALLSLANRACDDPDDREVALGAVIEIIHLATLVHDDSIDRSELRRGVPTLNRRWSDKVSIIMGDYLYSRAMAEITRVGDLDLTSLAARVSNEMAIGEMVEIAHHRRLVTDPRQYFFLIEKKTASLVATACEMGAAIGAPRHRAALRDYGQHLGVAFQLVDDLMDYDGEQAVMGKPAGSDLREGQVTYPLLAVLPRLSEAERATVAAAFPDDPEDESGSDPDRVAEVVDLVRRHGGLEATRALAEEYGDRARGTLLGLPPTPAREGLEAAIDYVVERDR